MEMNFRAFTARKKSDKELIGQCICTVSDKGKAPRNT